MAIIREHLATKGLGLHNDLQNESSIVGNFPTVLMMRDFGTDEQKARVDARLPRRHAAGSPSGSTEPNHGSRRHVPGDDRRAATATSGCINGTKRFNSGLHHATHDIIFARTSGEPGDAGRHHRVPRPDRRAGLQGRVLLVDVQHADRPRRGDAAPTCGCPTTAVFGEVDHGLELAQHFVHENRIRQAASSLGAGAVLHQRGGRLRATSASTWGKPLSRNQGIQFPLVELHTEAAMLRQLIRYTAWTLDRRHHMEVTHLVAMCNYRANRLACDAADRAMQTCGGVGYSRHMPFEHIYRHHRRYRITEGSEEIQMRKVAQQLFGFGRK